MTSRWIQGLSIGLFRSGNLREGAVKDHDESLVMIAAGIIAVLVIPIVCEVEKNRWHA